MNVLHSSQPSLPAPCLPVQRLVPSLASMLFGSINSIIRAGQEREGTWQKHISNRHMIKMTRPLR